VTDLPDRPPRGPDEHKALAEQLGLSSYLPLLVQSRNTDPYFQGSPAHQRDAEWFAEQWRRFGRSGHLRRLHYRLLGTGTSTAAGELYVNCKKHWEDLEKGSRKARILGLVNPEELDDQRNEQVRLYAPSRSEDPEPSWSWRPEPLSPWALPGEAPPSRLPEWDAPSSVWGPTSPIVDGWLELPDVPSWDLPGVPTWELPDTPELELPAVQPWGIRWSGLEALTRPAVDIAGYDYEPADQPVLLEVWAEKSSVADVLEGVCQRLGINLLVGMGYESHTRIIETARRGERYPTTRLHVLYVSDRDRAGDQMPLAVGRTIDFYRRQLAVDVHLTIQRVALTPEQIRTYELPEDPTQGGRVELEALEARHPGVLGDLVQHAVQRWRDPRIRSRLAETAGQARSVIEEQWEGETEELNDERAELEGEIREIIGRYPERFRALGADMATDLAPERADRDRLAADGAAAIEAFRPRVEGLAAELTAAVEAFQPRLDQLTAELTAALAEHQPRLEELTGRVDAKRQRFQERADALNAELDAELEPLRERLEELSSEAVQVLEGFDPELPDRPEPEEPEVDRDGLLFDSRRPWWMNVPGLRAMFGRNGEVTPTTDQSV
jgi:predicted component of type VI protein secretion system